MTYPCKICGLRYPTRELAEKCAAWCAEHGTCNIEIVRHAVEHGPDKSGEE